MARGRPPAPTSILPPGLNFCPIQNLYQMQLNRKYIDREILRDDIQCREWLALYGLIRNSRDCANCGNPMKLINDRDHIADQICWRCRDCNTETSIRTGSFFEGSHLKLQQIIELIYWWTINVTHEIVIEEVVVTEVTIIDWFSFIREACFLWVEDHAEQIGGVDPVTMEPKIIEIDESCFMQRKNNRGRERGHHWVFGGVERGTGKCFLFPVAHRNAATLLPIIELWVKPNTIIISDLWRAYGDIENLPAGYQHLTVNHSIEFVRPDDRTIHTNTIEGLWAHSKSKFRAMHGTSEANFTDYLSEFIWRKNFKHYRFGPIMGTIRDVYDPYR